MLPALNFVQTLLNVSAPNTLVTGLYAGGLFVSAGTTNANCVGYFDGTNWNALGAGVSGSFISAPRVMALATDGTNLFVGGNFTNAGGVLASNVAVWDGSSWLALPSGTGSVTPGTARGYCVAAAGNDVYIGGSFTFAGDKPAQFIAHWNSQSNYYPAAHIQLTRTMWQPNHQFGFRVTGTYGQSYIIQGSTDFNSWTPLQTNSTMFYNYSDPSAANYPYRFYRVILGP